MVPLKVLHRIHGGRCAFLLLCLVAVTTQLISQTNPYTISVGSVPNALAINPATNQIYVVASQGDVVSVIDGRNLTATPTRVIVGNLPIEAAVNPVTNRIYVANSGDGTISVIDGANLAATPATVTVGTTPGAIAVNRITNTVYVLNKDSNSVSVIDGTTNAVTNTVTVGSGPVAIVLNPVTNNIYVANGTSSVSVIDGANLTATPITVPAGAVPKAIAVNPVTNMVYVANGGNTVTVIDGADNGVVTTVTAGIGPDAIAVNTVANKIYVVNGTSNNVTVIDGASNTVKTNVRVGATPTEIAVNSLTNQVYVTNQDDTVSWIDGASDTVRTTIDLGSSANAVAVNPVTNKVYVTDVSNNTVSVIDGDINATSSLDAGTNSNPFGVAVNPVTNKTYVTNSATNQLLVIDGATNATTTVPAGSSPFAIAVNPVTNTIYLTNSPTPNGPGSVTVINGADNSIMATVPAGNAPNNVVVNPATNKIYASNSSGTTVTVIDGRNPTATPVTVTVGNRPNGIAIDEATNTLYVANIGDDTVSVIDGATNTVIATVPVLTVSPFTIALNPVTNKVYVGCAGNGNIVSVIDAANNYATGSVTAGSGAYNLAVNAVNNKIYVANQFDNSVTVIDGATDVPTRLPLIPGGSPYAVAVNPLTNKIYVTERGTSSNVVAVIDGASNTVLDLVPAGNNPLFLDVNTATNRVYVANYIGDTVTVIDAEGLQPVPLTTVIAGVVDSQTLPPPPGDLAFKVFQTLNTTPGFTVNVTSAYNASAPYTGLTATNPPPTQLYYEVDGVSSFNLATVTSAAGANPAAYTITLPQQQTGLHTLYVYAAYGNEAGRNSLIGGSGDSLDLGNLTAYPYLVTLPSTTTTVTSSANPQTIGSNLTFTAAVTPIPLGTSGPTGTVSFYDGTALLGTGPISLVSSSYLATFSTSSLTLGSHSILATYPGDTNYQGSSGALTQVITSAPATPASITASSGNGQTTVNGTSFPIPLVATVKDANGDGMEGVSVTFMANPGINGQSGTFSNSTDTITVATNSSGMASSGTFTANSKVGSYTVTAAVGALSATFNLTNALSAPATIVLTSGSGQGATIDSAFSNPLIATVLDGGGNPVPGATVTFTAPAGLTSTLAFSNASTTISEVTNSLGQASSGPMTANSIPGGPYDVQASVGLNAINFQLTNLGKTLTTFASLTTTAATIDVFGFGFSAPSGSLVFTDVNTSTPVSNLVILDASTAVTSLQPQVATSTGVNTLPVWTTLADLNGDGILDLVTSRYQTDSVSVQLGNGDGTFKAAMNFLIATGFGPAEVHAVSLRGNGTLDLIAGSFNLNQIAVLLGNGNGTFGTPTFYTVGSAINTPTSLTTGDFNDDGKTDVAVADTADNSISIFLGDGSGGLVLQSPAINVGRTPEAVRAGDFNGDGYSDLAVANYSDGTVTTLLNDKDGTFTATTKPVGSGAASGPQALAINGSGSTLLLAVANYRDNTVSVMQNDGSGSFGAQTIIPVGKGPDDVNFADFNGDGIPDLAVSNYSDGTVNLALGLATSYKVLGPFKVGDNPYSAAVGDLNFDGTPDLVVANCFSDNTGVLLDGTLITVPYSGLSLPPGNLFNASYAPDGVSKYGSSNSGNIAPQSSRILRGIPRKPPPKRHH